VGHCHVLLRADSDGAGTHLLALLSNLLVVLNVLNHAGVSSGGCRSRSSRSLRLLLVMLVVLLVRLLVVLLGLLLSLSDSLLLSGSLLL